MVVVYVVVVLVIVVVHCGGSYCSSCSCIRTVVALFRVGQVTNSS